MFSIFYYNKNVKMSVFFFFYYDILILGRSICRIYLINAIVVSKGKCISGMSKWPPHSSFLFILHFPCNEWEECYPRSLPSLFFGRGLYFYNLVEKVHLNYKTHKGIWGSIVKGHIYFIFLWTLFPCVLPLRKMFIAFFSVYGSL